MTMATSVEKEIARSCSPAPEYTWDRMTLVMSNEPDCDPQGECATVRVAMVYNTLSGWVAKRYSPSGFILYEGESSYPEGETNERAKARCKWYWDSILKAACIQMASGGA